MLVTQSNLANTYKVLGRKEDALRMMRDVYLGHLKLYGEEDRDTFLVAENYAITLIALQRFEEAKSVLRKIMPVAQRVLGENDEATIRMRWIYATALIRDPSATLDDLREVVTTLEETERIARRVLGGAHPTAAGIEKELQIVRVALRAREAPSSGSA